MATADKLAYKIEQFVRICESQNHATATGNAFNCPNFNAELFMVTEDEVEDGYEEDVEVPKALGDVFESLAGAVFLVSFFCSSESRLTAFSLRSSGLRHEARRCLARLLQSDEGCDRELLRESSALAHTRAF